MEEVRTIIWNDLNQNAKIDESFSLNSLNDIEKEYSLESLENSKLNADPSTKEQSVVGFER